MKFIYTALVLGILVTAGYSYYIVAKQADNRVENRYLACLERGNDADGCAKEQLLLRALTCR